MTSMSAKNDMNTGKRTADIVGPRLPCVATAKHSLKLLLVSYAPHMLRNESVNIAVILTGDGFTGVQFARDWGRVIALDPDADIELLEAVTFEIRDKLRVAGERETILLTMEDSWSNAIRLSSAKECLTENPADEIETLASQYL